MNENEYCRTSRKMIPFYVHENILSDGEMLGYRLVEINCIFNSISDDKDKTYYDDPNSFLYTHGIKKDETNRNYDAQNVAMH